ncbi:hypothetical protein GCM10007424_00510 [Flavobacterium suaedae]|uniref:Histidinol-phosphatase n=1 Tax=Flavobacterium suaedae TaxID=1767027 RepID=A0ABQ1JBM8_9FLAO|nr:hypothetical protein [Flavobacterium suaedae]GGB64512.1 hypothetical protein GCM10007424_00510 [Flavobacterium suaedae]
MKIDIHTHTKKIKSGDAPTRHVEVEDFQEILRSTDVKILAITNHNHFDVSQYKALRESVAGHTEVWPGIELDILENGKRSHILVIVNPSVVDEFANRTNTLLEGVNADTFTISLDDTVKLFDDLDCVYIAHYLAKKPNLGDAEINKLLGLVANPKRVLKEATNSISAGIYISHGHNSIYGSDVHDWSLYQQQSLDLPELRLPVSSFEQFCLLLEKDEVTINTLLNKKVKESVEIVPFTVADMVKLDIYNDINILFGSKGTGKTDILDSLSKYFNEKGHNTSVYKSNDIHLSDEFDIKGHDFHVTASDLGFNNCTEEINSLKSATDHDVTSLSKYKQYFSYTETNRISQKLKIKNITKEDEGQPGRQLFVIKHIVEKFSEFTAYIHENQNLSKFINEQLLNELQDVLERILGDLKDESEESLVNLQSVKMLNSIIDIFINEIAKKTGTPQKPSRTGFAEYASNRMKLEVQVKKIISNINHRITPMKELAGSLGVKGNLYCVTNLIVQNGSFTDGAYTTVKDVNKTPQKSFSKNLLIIINHLYENSLFEKITELNSIEGIETINSIEDLLLFYRHFTLNDNLYHPSSGESSMILLHKELLDDKEIYLIDEPEKSLGNDYINDVIVPILKEKAALGKKVIIATHDANIAVRTLPYNSIYRLHDQNQYYTMTGNPFSNTLRCIYGSRKELDWKEISMKTLEGGKEAFGERGKIYGN